MNDEQGHSNSGRACTASLHSQMVEELGLNPRPEIPHPEAVNRLRREPRLLRGRHKPQKCICSGEQLRPICFILTDHSPYLPI